jgi:hypothetical protein
VSVLLAWLVNHGRRLFLKALSNREYSLVWILVSPPRSVSLTLRELMCRRWWLPPSATPWAVAIDADRIRTMDSMREINIIILAGGRRAWFVRRRFYYFENNWHSREGRFLCEKVLNPSGMFIRLLAILAELEVLKRVNCYDSGRKSFFFRETRNSSILVLMTDSIPWVVKTSDHFCEPQFKK